MLKVTANTPDMEIVAKYHMGENFISGIGAHVNVTVSKRNGFRPHTSDRAPIRGALRNDNIPCEYYNIQVRPCYV